MIKQKEIVLKNHPRGFHLITKAVLQQFGDLPETGIFHLFIKHTSAALTVNENADPSVRTDFKTFMSGLVPDDYPEFTHTMEGPDDMSAHIKSSMMGSHLVLPITQHRLNLGTWQGIYLCEFREHGGSRKLVATSWH